MPFLLAFCFPNFFFAQHKESGKPDQRFSIQNLKEHLNILGHDSLQGRGTGSFGEQIAAEYLASVLNKYGVKTIAPNNSYYQTIPLHGSIPLPDCKLDIIYNSSSYECNLNIEYALYTSGEQTFLPSPAQLVFVGYGIVAPEFDYNDYQSVDVLGKIVVFIDGEPISQNENYFGGLEPTIYSFIDVKQQIALSRGAVGSILVPMSEVYAFTSWDRLVNEFLFENVSLASSVNKNLGLLFNPLYSYLLFKNSPFSLLDISEMHIENKMQSFEMNCSIFFKGSFKERDFLSSNVLGLIEGNDPILKDEFILVSAHYDHLGIGPAVEGDSIYNGVLDNALGVAGILELTRILNISKQELKRSIIIFLSAAEEKGLLGSIYYTSTPLLPLYKTIANINIDGLAFIDEFNSVVGIGTEYSSLKNTLEETIKQLNLNIGGLPEEFINLKSFYASDQAAFAAAGIPSIAIYESVDFRYTSKEEGIKKIINYIENIYHTPLDDLSQSINFDAVIQHLNLIYSFVMILANSNDYPKWNEDSPFVHERLRSIAEKR